MGIVHNVNSIILVWLLFKKVEKTINYFIILYSTIVFFTK